MNDKTLIEASGGELAQQPTAASTAIAVAAHDNSPIALLGEAIRNKMDPDTISKMMDLRDRWEAGEAKKAYVAAVAAFKAEPIEIFKTKQVKFDNRDGTQTKYKHAELSDITAAIAEPLSRHGLSYRWDVTQTESITVSCILTHIGGHSEKVTMTAPPDDSGKKNKIQQISSTTSYLERYTLLAITGLSTTDMDDDGRTAELERISDEQVAELRAKIKELGKDDDERDEILAQFLTFRQVDKLEDIAAQAFQDCKRALDARKQKTEKPATDKTSAP